MQPGDQIKPFRVPASTGMTLEWEAFAGKLPLVLVFLPGLEGEGNVEEISEFDRIHTDFGKERVQVLGVAKVTAADARRAAEEHDFTIPILADASGKIIADFGYSEPDGSARRATVIVAKDGTVAKTFDSAHPSGHAAAVLEAVRELKRSDQYKMTAASS